MDILAALRREEHKLEKQLSELQRKLSNVKAAGNAFANSARRDVNVVKKRVMSKAVRAKIARAARRRWARVRAEAKRASS